VYNVLLEEFEVFFEAKLTHINWHIIESKTLRRNTFQDCKSTPQDQLKWVEESEG